MIVSGKSSQHGHYGSDRLNVEYGWAVIEAYIEAALLNIWQLVEPNCHDFLGCFQVTRLIEKCSKISYSHRVMPHFLDVSHPPKLDGMLAELTRGLLRTCCVACSHNFVSPKNKSKSGLWYQPYCFCCHVFAQKLEAAGSNEWDFSGLKPQTSYCFFQSADGDCSNYVWYLHIDTYCICMCYVIS